MMKHKILSIAVIISFIFCATPAVARLYKYTDSKGIVHFTDKLATVPAKYKAEIVKEKETPRIKDPKPAETTSEFSAPQLSSESAKGKDVVEEPIESSEFSSPAKPAKSKPAPEQVSKVKEPAAPASEFSESQQTSEFTKSKPTDEESMITPLSASPKESSEFTPTPAPVEEPEKPAASEFTYKAQEPAVKEPEVVAEKEPPMEPADTVETGFIGSEFTKDREPADEPVASSTAAAPEKASEFTPTPAPIEEPEKPAASEFTYKAQETPVKEPEVVAEKEPPMEPADTVETGFIGSKDESIQQASVSQSADTIEPSPVVVEKEPEKPPVEPEMEKEAPQPEPAPTAVTKEPSQKSVKEIELAKMIEQRNILAEKKDALNNKFDELMKEKKRLEAVKDNPKDQAGIDQYNQDVKALNAKIKNYKEEEKALKEEIEEYNKSIKQSSIQ